MAFKIDKIDLNIIKILQEDGRITNLNLSQKIGLSPAPTLERVRKLEKNGIIEGYHAKISERKMGLGITAIVQVSLTRQMENALQNFGITVGEGRSYLLQINAKPLDYFKVFRCQKGSLVLFSYFMIDILILLCHSF